MVMDVNIASSTLYLVLLLLGNICIQAQETTSSSALCTRDTSLKNQAEILTAIKSSLIPAVTRMQQDITQIQCQGVINPENGRSVSVNTQNPYLYPRDCADLYNRGSQTSGVYTVYIFAAGQPVPFRVWCDMDTDRGAWMVFQRRMDGSVDFYRTWSEYADGFGNLTGEYWLGNHLLHLVTDEQEQELRVDLEDHEGETAHAKYNNFFVASQKLKFALTVDGYSGDAGNSFGWHNGYNFTTKDEDNDTSGGNCARLFHGAWWYKACHASNLNGGYRETGSHNGTSYADIVDWSAWRGHHYSIKFTEMKIRPITF